MNDHTFTVSELTTGLSDLFQQAFPTEVWVQGEIRGLSRRGGHVYFDLVDEGTLGVGSVPVLSIVLFDAKRQNVNNVIRRAGGGIKMNDGVKIRIRGRIDYYAPQSRVQFRMSMIDPLYTLGRLAADRQALLDSLRADDLLDRNATVVLEAMPLRVALITSQDSAAYSDFVDEMRRSKLAWQITCIDTRVQGELAPRLIAAALQLALDQSVDVVALVRGGGARTDLAVFDHELVARAIATMPIPVFTGIGHETDTSVADEVAHSTFKTPTACAVGLIEHARTFILETEQTWTAVLSRGQQAIDHHRSAVQDLAIAVSRQTNGSLRVAASRLDAHGERISLVAGHRLTAATDNMDRQDETLRRLAADAITDAARTLDTHASTIRHLDPERALERGWSITRTADGRIVRDPGAISIGTALVTTLALGTVSSTTTKTNTDPDPAIDPEIAQGTP